MNEDIYGADVGAVFFNTKRSQPKNVLLRIGFDELFVDGLNPHNLSTQIIYAF